MQGEAVLGLEAAARALVQPGTKVLNLVQGVFGKGMGYWLKDFGAELHELEVPYNDAVDPADVERYLDEQPGDRARHGRALRDSVGDAAATSRAIGPIAHARGALTLVDCVSSLGGIAARDRRVAARRLRRRRAEVPRRAARDVADDGQRRRLGANPRKPGAPRASFLSMLDWKEQWIDGDKFPFTPSVCDLYGVEAAVDELLEEGLESVDRAARALGCGLPRRRTRDGPRALAAQRRDRRGLRDRDHGARRADRRAR